MLSAYKQTPSAETPRLMADLATVTDQEPPPELGRGLWMTWDQVREVREVGMGIVGHTHTHPLPARIGPAEQAVEVRLSMERLRDAAGIRTRTRAYHVCGRDSFDATTKELLLANGFDPAFTFYGGHQSMDRFDPLDIRRTSVGVHVDQRMFEAKISLPRVFAR